jgi:propanol-preferring alcohol dehydrogenase
MSTTTMRAARLHGNRKVTVEDRSIPSPESGQVLLKVAAAGICGSDLGNYRSPTPEQAALDYVPGHEPCGDIVELGPGVTDWRVGDRVVVYHRCACKKCHYCLTGFRNLCTNRDMAGRRAYGFNPDGADEEYMVADAADLLPLPDNFDSVEGALLACQTGTAYYGLRNIDTRPSDKLIVTGLGPVGLLAVVLAKTMSLDVIGVDPVEARRNVAAGLGADAVIDPMAAPLAEQVHEIWPNGPTRWAEASGSSNVHGLIPEVADMHARVAIIGGGGGEPKLNVSHLMGKQIHLIGSNLWPFSAWDEITDFVTRRNAPIRDVVTHELSIDEAPMGFDLAGNAESGKVVFRFD